ncbi:unnamed protein product [Prorocentrum cordatum]|uniref:Uncharacterized protein n=1 Tax=Prorocentrum cordatum TaxID=2364126 RepID=A0ABN9WQL6_9DINO|nr:unnamed protein product [Polarella glacialis]
MTVDGQFLRGMAAFQQDGVKSYRKINLEHQAGEVFSVIPETSNRETLWSELFQEKERAMMRKHLISRVVSFSVKDTYQISVRMLWTKDALDLSMQTLEADADRRRRPSSEGLGTSRRRRNEKLMAKLRDLHVGATGNEGFGGSAPHPVPRYAGGD